MSITNQQQALADEAGKIIGLIRAGKRGEALTELRLSKRRTEIDSFNTHWHGDEWKRFADWAIGEGLGKAQ